MSEPSRKLLKQIDDEFPDAFRMDRVEQMSDAGMQRLAEDLARVAPCGYRINSDPPVSMESYGALHSDFQRAIDQRRKAEDMRDGIAELLNDCQIRNAAEKRRAKWLLCGAWLLAWVFAAAWLGGR